MHLVHVFGCHVALEIEKPLRKWPMAVGADEAAVGAVILQHVLDERVLVAELVAAPGTFQNVFADVERVEGSILKCRNLSSVQLGVETFDMYKRFLNLPVDHAEEGQRQRIWNRRSWIRDTRQRAVVQKG
jgi:hypothetical protein